MAVGCAPHRDRRCTDYAMTRLVWGAELGSHDSQKNLQPSWTVKTNSTRSSITLHACPGHRPVQHITHSQTLKHTLGIMHSGLALVAGPLCPQPLCPQSPRRKKKRKRRTHPIFSLLDLCNTARQSQQQLTSCKNVSQCYFTITISVFCSITIIHQYS